MGSVGLTGGIKVVNETPYDRYLDGLGRLTMAQAEKLKKESRCSITALDRLNGCRWNLTASGHLKGVLS